MPWPNGTRQKTFAAGGSLTPGDANAIEDRMLKIAGYRGFSRITGEHSTTSTTYTKLGTTPGVDRDEVQGIVVPPQGILRIIYFAAVKVSVTPATISSAFFIGANQLRSFGAVNEDLDAMPLHEGTTGSGSGEPTENSLGINKYASQQNMTFAAQKPVNAGSGETSGDPSFTAFPTTPHTISVFTIRAAPGTYDISVQYKITAGTLSVKDRTLLVESVGFD